MNSNTLNMLFVPGTSKVTLGGIIPTLIEYTNSLIFCLTTSTTFENVKKIVLKGLPEIINYNVIYAKKDYDFQKLLEEMISQNIRVAIINVNHKLYHQILSLSEGKIWLSACREGIYKYLSDIKNLVNRETYIIGLDNNQNMLKDAKAQYKNSNLIVTPATIHCICSSIDIDLEKAIIDCSAECTIIFSPEAAVFKNYIDNSKNIFELRANLQFCETEEDYKHYQLVKMININVLHTVTCLKAYDKGLKKDLSISDITKITFSELMNKEECLDFVLNIHSLLYDKYLSKHALKLGDSKEIYSGVAKTFINNLFDSKELIGRGLNPYDKSYNAKKEYHFDLLKSINNSEVLLLINNLETAIKKETSL